MAFSRNLIKSLKDEKIDCKRILVSCQPRYWNDSEVNGIGDIDFYESKGHGTPQIPCAEQIKDKPTNVIHSDHWVWRPIIDVETGQITNWDKEIVYKFLTDILNERDNIQMR